MCGREADEVRHMGEKGCVWGGGRQENLFVFIFGLERKRKHFTFLKVKKTQQRQFCLILISLTWNIYFIGGHS